ncbi:MAG: NAD kinase, partial [Mycobacterium sp.]
IPVLGVNLGRIGFLAEAEAEAIDSVLEHVVAQSYRVEDRLTLDVAVRVKGEVVERGWALNDASLEKGPRLGVLGVVVEVDGRPVSTFGCDGVLVSTPTGSTAYAFSAGGPVLWPDLEAILVVPNNAHALFARPMVTSPAAAIAIEVEAGGHDALVFCDGRREMLVPAGGRLEVTRCDTAVRWARLDSAPFTDRLVRKFRLPVAGWRGQ